MHRAAGEVLIVPKMLGKVLKSLVTKPATVRYPYVKPEPVPGIRGGIGFDMKKCDQCQDCERVCPSAAIRVYYDEKKVEYFPFRCICCHLCIQSCNQGAIVADSSVRAPNYEKVVETFKG